ARRSSVRLAPPYEAPARRAVEAVLPVLPVADLAELTGVQAFLAPAQSGVDVAGAAGLDDGHGRRRPRGLRDRRLSGAGREGNGGSKEQRCPQKALSHDSSLSPRHDLLRPPPREQGIPGSGVRGGRLPEQEAILVRIALRPFGHLLD